MIQLPRGTLKSSAREVGKTRILRISKTGSKKLGFCRVGKGDGWRVSVYSHQITTLAMMPRPQLPEAPRSAGTWLPASRPAPIFWNVTD